MSEQQQKWYRVLAPDGLHVRVGESDQFKHIRKGRVVPRDTFAQITWLLDGGFVEECDPPHKAEPDDGEAA